MSEFFKSKRNLALALSAFFMAVTLLAGSIAYLMVDVDLVASADEGSSQASEPGEEDPVDGEDGEEDGEQDGDPEDGEDDTHSDVQEDGPVHFNVPSEMRAVILTPGTDFITSTDTTEAAIKAEIDKAYADAKSLSMNTVIIDTTYDKSVIYQTKDAPELSPDFDIMEYVVDGARENNFYTYAIFDASFYKNSQSGAATLAVGAGTVNSLAGNLREFAEKYQVDGILIDGYQNAQAPQSYSIYTVVGGAMGYDNFMLQSSEAIVKTASNTLRTHAKGTQVGLLADSVWENNTDKEEGSATKATFTALSDGNADTRAYVEDGLVDFVAVKAYASLTDAAEPFKEVVSWWGEVTRNAGIPMYAIHASDKLCTDSAGWSSQDQLVRQVIEAQDIKGYSGSVFNSLQRLVEDPQGAATTLIKYYNEEVEAAHILTTLAVTKPEQTTYTTNEPVVTFVGASDPNSPVTINGEAITTDSNGYFTVTKELSGGANTFTIEHKDKTVNYSIIREIEILKDISPQGSIVAEGSMSITITAMAYEEAAVHAVVNGTTVSMSIDETAEDEQDRDSSYKRFVGRYTAPAATSSEQNLGNIVVNASWQGQEKSIQGASVKVNKKAKIEDGVPVVVVTDQARTYPPNTLDNIPVAAYYPLPQGAMDYAVGEEIVYKKGSDTYTYFVLASGMRVEAGDISTSSDYASGNVINDMDVSVKSGYTYVTLKTTQQVSYSFEYGSSGVKIQFHNTVQGAKDVTLSQNPLFTKATWSGNDTLSLSFQKDDGFMGYKGYYNDEGELVFRFNNPPSSVSSARIVIDPGHGGKDVGALGFLADYPEKVLNLAIAQMLADELESRGATVLLLDTSSGMELNERVRQAENFNADLLVSIHNNTAPNSNATGTEVYYFYPYAKNLAAYASSNVSNQLNTNNRGARQSYYTVTLSSQVPSILVECGFMSNKGEYEKLIKSKNQEKIATGVANAIASAIKAANSGIADTSASTSAGSTTTTVSTSGGSSTQDKDKGTDQADTNTPSTTTGSGSGTVAVEGVILDMDSYSLEVGESDTLDANIYPTNATNKNLTWKSSNTKVATVNANGKITAVGEGTAKITVTTESGGKTATCTVKVTDSDNEPDTDKNNNIEYGDGELEIVQDSEALEVGKTLALKLRLDSSVDADDILWESSDPDIATVDQSGKVTAVSSGQCTIIASTDDYELEDICEIIVMDKDDLYDDDNNDYIRLKDTDEVYFEYTGIKLLPGKKTTLRLLADDDVSYVRPSDLLWKSSNTSIATVSASGVVTAKSKTGDVKITAYTKDDEYYAQCTVTVTKDKVNVTGVTLNKSSISVVRGETNKELKATISPSNATVTDLTWKSSNDRIATVTSEGVVKGVNRGTVTITASSKDGKVKATCQVEVVRDPVEIEEIEFDWGDFETWVGDEDYLEVYAYPENASLTNLVWKSSNTKVVTVDDKGNYKAVGKGKATITVSLKDNSKIKATCQITVDD